MWFSPFPRNDLKHLETPEWPIEIPDGKWWHWKASGEDGLQFGWRTTKIWIAEVAYLNQFRDASIHEADFEAEDGAVRAGIGSRGQHEICS
jgi:hypothetical protein